MNPLPTRQTLIQKIIDQRNDYAWEDFVNYYQNYLENILRKYQINPTDAEDILQSTLVKVWELLPSFNYDQNKGRFRSWLTQVTINIMREQLRKNNRLNKALSEGKLNDFEKASEAFAIDFEKEWREYMAKKTWDNVSETLSPEIKTAFELHLEGLRNREISEQTGIPEANLKVYIGRVRIKLNQELSRLEEDF